MSIEGQGHFLNLAQGRVYTAFLWEKVKTVELLETIAACDLKVGRCRQLIEIMKVCEYLRLRPFLYHIFSCFVLYSAKISGECLQDHWSSSQICHLNLISLVFTVCCSV